MNTVLEIEELLWGTMKIVYLGEYFYQTTISMA